MNRWRHAFAGDSTDAIRTLYEEQACLWGTLSSIRRDNRDEIEAYFKQAFVYSNRRVEFDEPHIRLFENFAVSSGTYRFSWESGGEMVTTEARYSLVYVNRRGEWLITEHHSSRMPESR